MSKRELGRYAPKKRKTGRSPVNAGDLAALDTTTCQPCKQQQIASGDELSLVIL